MAVSDLTAVNYRYFTTDLLSNTILAEIPFKGVSYERSIKTAGAFSGSIPVIPSTGGAAGTESMNLYDSTMPGKTALYVMRDDECVWGGIIWTRSYDVITRNLTVNASEFQSYLHHRVAWKTWSHDFGADYTVTGTTDKTLSFTLQNSQKYSEFTAGQDVYISFLSGASKDIRYKFGGYYTLLSGPTDSTFSITIPDTATNGTFPSDDGIATVTVRPDTYDYTRQLLQSLNIDFSNVDFPNDEIEPGTAYFFNLVSSSRTANIATMTTDAEHALIPGQVVKIANVGASFDGSHVVTAVPSATTFTYASFGSTQSTTSLSPNSQTIILRSLTTNVVTITTESTHGFEINDIVVVKGVDTAVDGTFVITATPSTTQFRYGLYTGDILEGSMVGTATATVSPSVTYASYGGFTYNSDVDIAVSGEEYSGKNVPNKTYRGYELQNIGDALETYSNTVDGFEYRIDCSYDGATSSFSRTFVLMPITPAGFPTLAAGEVAEPSDFGADTLVFEYPGSISSATMDESAESSATRFWVIGDIGDIGPESSQPYSAATAYDLLDAGWPILEEVESQKDTGDEETLALFAETYLNESRPPQSNIEIQVNGSMEPKIGSYSPGDWCIIVLNDEFVNLRLASDLEPRDTVIVRKIDGFSVSVPDSPSFPETVTLVLVTEPGVDKRGS
jgi:hypothetical protein